MIDMRTNLRFLLMSSMRLSTGACFFSPVGLCVPVYGVGIE